LGGRSSHPHGRRSIYGDRKIELGLPLAVIWGLVIAGMVGVVLAAMAGLERVREKWEPVFRPDARQIKNLERE